MPDSKLGRQLDILVLSLCMFLIYQARIVYGLSTTQSLMIALPLSFATRQLLHGPLYSRLRRFHNKYGFVFLAGIVAMLLAMLARGLRQLLY